MMNLFIPITKIDEEKRLVYGTIAEEVPDHSGEIFDYATSKPNFEKWSSDFEKVTDGKSLGNVRAMHGLTAAGKLTTIAFEDDSKKIEACAKVVDDAEWDKCLEGVYTGFSVGGKYVKRWKDGDLTRYTADPNEVSLVDKPCIPTATFSLVKADGSMEIREFKIIAEESAKKGESMKKAKILEDLQKWSGQEVWDVKAAVEALTSVMCLFECEAQEDHPEAAAQTEALRVVIENLKTFIASEIQETTSTSETVITLADATGDLVKAGARNAKGDLDKIQGIHDHAISLGAKCDAAKTDENGNLAKVEQEKNDALLKVETLTAENNELKKTVDEQAAKIKEWEDAPASDKTIVKAVVVEKTDDVLPDDTKPAEPKTPEEAIKKAYQSPKMMVFGDMAKV